MELLKTVGKNGYILKADSTADGGISWLQTLPVANGGGYQVLQKDQY